MATLHAARRLRACWPGGAAAPAGVILGEDVVVAAGTHPVARAHLQVVAVLRRGRDSGGPRPRSAATPALRVPGKLEVKARWAVPISKSDVGDPISARRGATIAPTTTAAVGRGAVRCSTTSVMCGATISLAGHHASAAAGAFRLWRRAQSASGVPSEDEVLTIWASPISRHGLHLAPGHCAQPVKGG